MLNDCRFRQRDFSLLFPCREIEWDAESEKKFRFSAHFLRELVSRISDVIKMSFLRFLLILTALSSTKSFRFFFNFSVRIVHFLLLVKYFRFHFLLISSTASSFGASLSKLLNDSLVFLFLHFLFLVFLLKSWIFTYLVSAKMFNDTR